MFEVFSTEPIAPEPYNAAMPSVLTVLTASLLLVCSGCLTNIRPTVTGQVINATTGQLVPGVAVGVDDVS